MKPSDWLKPLFVLLVLLLLFALNEKLPAQSPTNVPFHKIGSADKVTLYKTVHYGCEIFVAVGDNGRTGEIIKDWASPVAITTGRCQ